MLKASTFHWSSGVMCVQFLLIRYEFLDDYNSENLLQVRDKYRCFSYFIRIYLDIQIFWIA